MGATDDGARESGDWSSLKFYARILTVAALAVGIVFATPAVARSPRLVDMAMSVRTPQMAKLYAKTQLNRYDWDSRSEWVCLHTLWTNESNWRPNAKNHTPVHQVINGERVKLYAGGIPQKLGLSPKANIPTQIEQGFIYIESRYGSPCQALKWWNKHKWY